MFVDACRVYIWLHGYITSHPADGHGRPSELGLCTFATRHDECFHLLKELRTHLLNDLNNYLNAGIYWKSGEYIYIYIYQPKMMISPYSTNKQKMVVKPMNNWGVHHWNRANCGSGVLENKNFAMLMFWLLASIVLKKNNVSGDTIKSLLKMWLEQSSFAMLRVPGSVYMDLI